MSLQTLSSRQYFKNLQALAAALLADAIVKIVPQAKLLKGGSADIGFYYDFLVKQLVTKDLFPAIEETMRSTIREGISIKRLEMIPAVAEGLFEEMGQEEKAGECMESPLQILPIIRIGNFYDVATLEGIETTAELKAFELIDCSEIPSDDLAKGWKILRIKGIAAPNRQVIKESFKSLKEIQRRNHQLSGSAMGLFEKPGLQAAPLSWLPKGVLLQDALKAWQRSLLPLALPLAPLASDESFSAQALVQLAAIAYHALPRNEMEPAPLFQGTLLNSSPTSGGEGLLYVPIETFNPFVAFTSQEQFPALLISFLQCVHKTTRLLNVEQEVAIALPKNQAKQPALFASALNVMKTVLVDQKISFEMREGSERQGRSLELTVNWRDFAGRVWLGPFLRVEPPSSHKIKEKRAHPLTILFSIMGSIERYVGLLLEQREVALPFFLSPEQIRILPLSQEQRQQAHQLHSSLAVLSIRATVDHRPGDLNARLLDAKKAYVPWVVILGAGEAAKGKAILRQLPDGALHEVAFDSIAGRLLEEIDVSKEAMDKYRF